MASPRTEHRDQDPKFVQFAEYYIAGGVDNDGKTFKAGNAHRSCLTAGYDREFARAHSHELAMRIKAKMGTAVRAQGINEVVLAKFLAKKLKARSVKWDKNKPRHRAVDSAAPAEGQPKEPAVQFGDWEEFEDHGTQMAAADMLGRILDVFPATKHAGPNGGAIPVRVTTSIQREKRA